MKTIKEMKAKLQAKKQDNKGFSLVELIIVIAIMAILVGIIASQVIPYMEKSRESKDLTTLDTCYTSFQTALANQESTTGYSWGRVDAMAATDPVLTEALRLIGVSNVADIEKKFKSEASGKQHTWTQGATDNGKHLFIEVSNGAITVAVGGLRVNSDGSAVCK